MPRGSLHTRFCKHFAVPDSGPVSNHLERFNSERILDLCLTIINWNLITLKSRYLSLFTFGFMFVGKI